LTLKFGAVVGDIQNIYEAVQHPTGLNVSAAVIGIIPDIGPLAAKGMKAARAGETATKDVVSAEARAQELHALLDPRAQRARTTAVTETEEGIRVVSSSRRRLSPAQRRALNENEVEGVGVGHAEVTGETAARRMGLTPSGTAASRPICSGCAQHLDDTGVAPLSPLKN
jgi:hypothetical protein